MTNMSDELQKEIELAVGQVIFNTSNYPSRVQARVMGTDMTKLRNAVVSEVMKVIAEWEKDKGEDEPIELAETETTKTELHFCHTILFFGGVEVSRCILPEGHEGRHKNIFTDWG